MDNSGIIYDCLHIYPVMLWAIMGHLLLFAYISSNALGNPGGIYGCLHIYPVMPWTILESLMIVYIYIQYCCGQSWGHLWLSTYISSNAVDNRRVSYGCLHIYPVIPYAILGSSMSAYIYIQ